MAGTRSQQSLGHFARLNQTVYIHQPKSNDSSRDPGLILLAAWMDASIRNVAKYTAGYEKLYPSARILVIMTSSTDVVFRSETANLNRVAPVLDILYSLPSDVKFLVHSFSNGGALTTSLIAREFLAKTGTSAARDSLGSGFLPWESNASRRYSRICCWAAQILHLQMAYCYRHQHLLLDDEVLVLDYTAD